MDIPHVRAVIEQLIRQVQRRACDIFAQDQIICGASEDEAGVLCTVKRWIFPGLPNADRAGEEAPLVAAICCSEAGS